MHKDDERIYAATYGRGLWKNKIVESGDCDIVSAEIGYTTGCGDGTSDVVILVHYENIPLGGKLSINAALYSITGSPQSIPMSGLTSGSSLALDISIDVEPTCSLDTTLTLPAICGCDNPNYIALAALYDSLDGVNWINNAGWNSNSSDCDYCNWHGVVCDENGEVLELQLVNNNLAGALPSEIGLLSELEILSIQDNNISGSIPIEFYNLNSLEFLTAHSNNITDTLSEHIGDLSNLYFIDLSHNSINGPLPQNLYGMHALQYFYVLNNNIQGPIDPQLMTMTNLYGLVLGGNPITGTIPGNIGNLSSLLYLYLHSAQLSGEIPASLGDLTNLRYLYLDNNNLSDTIPHSLANLDLIIRARLNDNNLSGCFPNGLSHWCDESYNFINNPLLPNGGDFASFCANGDGACVDICSDGIINAMEIDIDCGPSSSCGLCICDSVTIVDDDYHESFEMDLGLWSQGIEDDIDWTRDAFGTPSVNTGPSSAYDGSFYLYTEASNNQNRSAELYSHCLDLSSMKIPYLTIPYHMYGQFMGNLVVDISYDAGNSWNRFDSVGGINQDEWMTLGDFIPNSSTIKIRITGTTGPSFSSDMAIDYISIEEMCPWPDTLDISGLLDSSEPLVFEARELVKASSHLINNSDLEIYTGDEIQFLANFEIDEGSTLYAAIDDCISALGRTPSEPLRNKLLRQINESIKSNVNFATYGEGISKDLLNETNLDELIYLPLNEEGEQIRQD